MPGPEQSTPASFFEPIKQGGLRIGFLPFDNFRLINTALVESTSYDSQTLPKFKLGSFTVATPPQSNGPRALDNYQITIAAVSIVPEKARWAIILVGFGSVGYSMLSARQNQKVTVSFT
jgi:hypothetical protein